MLKYTESLGLDRVVAIEVVLATQNQIRSLNDFIEILRKGACMIIIVSHRFVQSIRFTPSLYACIVLNYLLMLGGSKGIELRFWAMWRTSISSLNK